MDNASSAAVLPDDYPGNERASSSQEPAEATFHLGEALVVSSNSASSRAESIRSLRSNLLAQHVKLGRRGLAICAASAGSGSSFIAANLAMSMAQAGVNTLLIDADLRNPSLHHFIAPSIDRPGLNECMRDDALSLGSAIAMVTPNLSILYAGHSDAQSQDRLGSSQFRSLIGQCLRDFDLTIIDTPPANESADAKRVASVVRHAMIVTCRNRSYVRDVEVLLEELVNDGVQVVGTYLNDY